jgi:hypothetical protein
MTIAKIAMQLVFGGIVARVVRLHSVCCVHQQAKHNGNAQRHLPSTQWRLNDDIDYAILSFSLNVQDEQQNRNKPANRLLANNENTG